MILVESFFVVSEEQRIGAPIDRFGPASRAIHSAREECDVVLYVINAAESPEDARYVGAEMKILDWIGKPVLVLLNQLDPQRTRARTESDVALWRAHLGSHDCIRGVLPLDAYTREDFAARGERYDVMLDLVGNRSLADCKRVLKPSGRFVASAGNPGGPVLGAIPWLLGVHVANLFASQTLGSFMTRPRREDLLFLTELIEAGKVVPVIEGRHPLARAADAVRHVATGHAQGKSVITV